MNEHFLTEIEIKQFKCFTDFRVSGFKRVNLIGGKNNVGKTAFMEACYINVHSVNVDKILTAIINTKFSREFLNIAANIDHIDNQRYLDSIGSYSAKSSLKNVEFDVVKKSGIKEYKVVIDDKDNVINSNDLSIDANSISNIMNIDNFGCDSGGLIRFYQAVQKQDQENQLNDYIHEFDNSIERFKVIGEKPQCKSNGEYRDITEFGDGLRHYISIICALYACENGYLFIDEIDNGIHYTQLDRLWEIILTVSKKTNCQIFAITHSKEMIESFGRVSKVIGECDISYTRLVKNKQQEIKAVVMDYEVFLNSLDQEHEVRGW
ncbi:MAG: AAA family ATPase [Methylobacter sp.]